MPPTTQLLSTMKPTIEAIGQRFGVSQIRVFGSVARGTATELSDIDLLVHVEPRRSLLDVIGFEQSVAELLGVKVDVVTERALHPMLEDSIRREALPL